MTPPNKGSELALPAEVLAAMQRAAQGHGEGASFLRAIGEELGAPVLESVSGGSEDPAEALAEDFWAGLRDYFSSRGWGTVSHERIHPGLGRLRAVDWAERKSDSGSPLTAGLLAGLFTALAGQAIDVVEAPRSDDEADLAFVFGSTEAVGELRRLLGEGTDLSGALDRL